MKNLNTIYGPGTFLAPRLIEENSKWITRNLHVIEFMTSRLLICAGNMPIICHRANLSPDGLAAIRDAGLSIAGHCDEYTTRTEYVDAVNSRLAKSEIYPPVNEMIVYKGEQKFFVSDSIFLNNEDIRTAEVIDWQTLPKVKVLLNDNGQRKFAEFTENHIGKNAAILVDHKLMSAPKINAPIREGILLIIGHFDHEEAVGIAEGIVLSN